MDDISERPSKLIHNVLIENGKVSTILFRINIYNNTLTHVLNTITEKETSNIRRNIYNKRRQLPVPV
jgi:hypothetical protein